MVVKWSDKVEGSGDDIHLPLCSGLYKEEEDSLVPWSGTDPSTLSDHLTTTIVYVPTYGAWLLVIAPSGAESSVCVDSCLSSSEKKP